MKNKVFTVVLILLFIILLCFVSNIVKKQSDMKISETNVALEENVINEEEVKSMVKNINGENFEEEVLKSDKKVLIDFYADWCGPCQVLSPMVEEFANENTDIKVVKINIDTNPSLAMKYGVNAIPTLVVIENGEIKNESVGLISKTELTALVK